MKILIAYDGSDSADTAIDGLQRAGLPDENVEALVVSVSEVWLPEPARDELLDDTFPLQIPHGLKEARERSAHVMEEAEGFAERGSKRVQQIFSQWQISHEAETGRDRTADLGFYDPAL